jgi:anti-anti-sigma regulatory factor
MKKLTIQLGGQRGCLGLSLRGNCITAADAEQLEQATQQLLTTLASRIWIDCQQLHALSPLGQHALAQLASSGLELLPATDFRGPSFLLSGLCVQTPA